MKILFDTNILVRITDVRTELPPQYADIVRLSNALHYTICYHPAQRDDLMRDKDVMRQRINFSRLAQYECLVDPPHLTVECLQRYKWQQTSDNSRVDNELLYAASQGAVDWLVTEDERMHHKAKRAGISDVVLYVKDYLNALSKSLGARESNTGDLLNLKEVPLHQIPLEHELFDSLRLSYNGFDIWFRNSARAGRKAWVAYDQHKDIKALCIFKEEGPNDDIGGNTYLKGKTLKLCTFKVIGRGEKLGERMLQRAFMYAVNENYDHIYMQIREGGHRELVDLIEHFGFNPYARYEKNNRTDISYVKCMRPPVGEIVPVTVRERYKFDVAYYPHFIDGIMVRKFLVPIKDGYHSMLFPDSQMQDMLFLSGCFGFPAENNAITKAYVCRANTKQMRPGDLLLFYNTGLNKSFEVVGFVDRVFRSQDANEILHAIARRTVYRDDTIYEMVSNAVDKHKHILVILFRILHYLPQPITRAQLKASGIKGNIQSIRIFPESIYKSIVHPQLARYTFEKGN